MNEHDTVELLVDVLGEDRHGQPRTFGAGAVGVIVNVSVGGDWYHVEVMRGEGPAFPAAGFRGETLGFFSATADQLRVVHDNDR